MERTNKKYDEEYKKNIVKLVENGKPISDIEREYGINRKNIEKDYVDVWLLRQNINIKDLKFNDNEVQAAKWATIEEWKKLLIEEQAVKSSTDYFLNYINNEF